MTDPTPASDAFRCYVAIVEDDADSAMLATASLSPHFDVRSFARGEDALESFRDRAPDAVVLDIGMRGGMDGLQLFNAMRADDRLAVVPALALTAYAGPGMRDRFLGFGFGGYVAKPLLEPEQLLQAVRDLMGGRPGTA